MIARHCFPNTFFEDLNTLFETDNLPGVNIAETDEAFARSLHVLVGRPITGQRGEALHLWHPRIGRTGKDLWEGQESDTANRELGNAYRRARTPEAMRALIDEQDAVGAV